MFIFIKWRMENDRKYCYNIQYDAGTQGVTKRCRLSWLANSALVYEPKFRGVRSCGVSANEYTLIKKKIKFSAYIRKFRWERLQSHIWEGIPNI
jgi:hypothetical protein